MTLADDFLIAVEPFPISKTRMKATVASLQHVLGGEFMDGTPYVYIRFRNYPQTYLILRFLEDGKFFSLDVGHLYPKKAIPLDLQIKVGMEYLDDPLGEVYRGCLAAYHLRESEDEKTLYTKDKRVFWYKGAFFWQGEIP